jgi:arabinan endo-1,5-alpha-L-arabinosidase
MNKAIITCLLLGATACLSGEEEDSSDVGVIDAPATQPFHGRFGSPSIVRDGGRLHAYFPIQGFAGKTIHVAHARSDDGGAHWFRVGDDGEALPHLNKLAVPGGAVWAPGAAKLADGKWMLYYTAVRSGTAEHMCTYRAHSKTAHGPFVDDFGGPLICPDGGLWAIDPYPVQDAGGDWHLLARIDEGNGVNTIQIRKLAPGGQKFADGSAWSQLTRINKGGWEEPVMENASIVRLDANGQKRWYVFYSGGSYKNNSYAVGYADCGTTMNGPCVKKTVDKPWLSNRPDLDMYGPGTPTFWTAENGDTMMAVNTWKFSGGQNNPKNHGQVMHIFKVNINASGKPVATFVRMVE